MTTRERIDALRALDRKMMTLQDAASVLSFDEETAMPPMGAEGRGAQIGALSALVHEIGTGSEMKSLVDALSKEDLNEADKALVHHHQRYLSHEGRLPAAFIEEEARLISLSQVAWVKAREASDFSLFAPWLEKIIALEKEKARIINPDAPAYDTLLDLYEEGQDAASVAAVFDPLEEGIHRIQEMIGGRTVETGFLYEQYNAARVHEFCLSVIDRMGFDRERGAVSISVHPFTSYLGQDDIRITTRYTDPSWFDPISTIVHECGHALYDMHASLNPAIRGTSVGLGRSMSLHESQSRFWENLVLRGRAFWDCCYTDLVNAVDTLRGVSIDDFWRAINSSKPSAIRVNADELTYALHIILRFRLEKALVEGDLEVAGLPEAWNQMSQEVIGYSVKDDREGCLQDSHWAQGLYGYFPSYALGSIADAAFYQALAADCGGNDGLEKAISEGRWSVVSGFLNKEIWSHGSMYGFDETVRRVTGRGLDVGCHLAYLEGKYRQVYNP